MERKFNCSEEQAMDYDYLTRMEKILGQHIELPKELKIINEKISKGLCNGVTLIGTTGSGRVAYANLMARELKAPTFRLSFTSETRLEDIYLSQTFSEPIEKGGFLIIDGMEFCCENVIRWLEKWFLWILPGRKLEKPKLDILVEIPEYIMSPNFVLVLILNVDHWRRSIKWFANYPIFAIYGNIPNPLTIRKLYKEEKTDERK